ncbi:unnamed protein product [Cuscuta campestris]|uniref:DUF1685 domain-containing protein n=1 Tax=Cuscuta campestris TaxID=132261 RepID=A0A484KMP7_9ASTE|nr:unnamed protein product [Cuscuta campestris]
MEGAEEILKLFDSCWFEQEILIVNETNKPLIHDLIRSEEKMGSLKIRSQSDNLLEFRTNLSPESRYRKRVQGEGRKKKKVRAAGAEAGEKLGSAKSLSELELEELKGFMDLGFVFTDEDKKSGLASIVPGLQRWGSRGRGEEDDDEEEGEEESNGNEAIIERPYLSEAWRSMDQRKMIKKLLKWRIPPGPRDDDESAMKDNLRFWAQTVASALR